MRKLSWRALALLGAALAPVAAFAGCGSEDSDIHSPTTDGGDENANSDGSSSGSDGNVSNNDTGTKDADVGDVIIDGSRDPDGSVACTVQGNACTSSAECCTANCAAATDGGAKSCAAPVTLCKTPGTACVLGNECCTGSCDNGTCSNILCEADGLSCAVANDCCSQNCVAQPGGGGKCQTLNPGGKPTSGNPCTTNSNCASGWCNNGVCANPSFCTVDGDICSTDQQCCGGLCNKVGGNSVGVCKNVATGVVGGTCLPAGELCSPNGTCTGASCCSRSCAPSPTSGLGVCQPESGCHIIGDLCTSTSECCGVKDQPGSIKGGGGGPSTDVQCQKQAGQTFGVCNYVSTVCSPAGALCKPGNATSGGAMSCSTKADCCAGNDNQYPTCQIDTNGIPRCTVTNDTLPDGGFQCQPTGGQCASSADCCGAPCISTNGGTPAFICGTIGQCQKQGQTCTSTSDCCPGLPCAIPPGSTTGICGGTVLTDGGVTDAAPPGSDGGVVVPPDSGTDSGSGGTCALYGQTCTSNGDCCNAVPCDTTGTHTCHYP